MTYAAFRSSHKTYWSRPNRLCSAQVAWDMLAATGEVESLALLDGYWCCLYRAEKGQMQRFDDMEAPLVLHRYRQIRDSRKRNA